MLHSIGNLFNWPWIYVLVGLSVLLDVFLPVLPSGVLVISAATAGSTGARDGLLDIAVLLVCAATASCAGDLLAYRLAWRGGDWFDRRVAGSRRLRAAHERLGQVLNRGGGTLVVLARFAPAGRSVVSLGAGAARRRPREFLPWSALAGLCWATYSVGLGWAGGRWLGASWFGTAMSFVALLAAGAFAALVFRRERRMAIAAAGTAVLAVPAPGALLTDAAALMDTAAAAGSTEDVPGTTRAAGTIEEQAAAAAPLTTVTPVTQIAAVPPQLPPERGPVVEAL
ncbi:DedA family protein [Actinacidiphila yeochonensis]|uniref:DedA family protein n=1 Tax=Actinacidiphila yeochonensis TaxID=89050 RepID=UPI00099DCAA9|nr:VTT domain-containing protein [Actinacidiphila yeochonensis]